MEASADEEIFVGVWAFSPGRTRVDVKIFEF